MAVSSVASRAEPPPRSATWIDGRRNDQALIWAWVPFVVATVALGGSAGGVRAVAMVALGASLLHQPITLALVYGDADQFRARRRLFVWAPVVLAAAIVVGLRIDFMLVAVIGALWNTEHTLMQRYGIVRIYRRKGPSAPPAGRADQAMLAGWLFVVLAWAAASPRTGDHIDRLGLGTANDRGLRILVDLRPVAVGLLVVAALLALAATGLWLARESRGGFGANPAAYCYLASTGLLFVVAAVHPVAGLLGWVGAHAVEYFVIVRTNLVRRYPVEEPPRAMVGRAIRGPLGPTGFVAVFSMVAAAVVLWLELNASLVVYGVVFFGIGGLHIIFDGVIWKRRAPGMAQTFGVGG